MNFDKFLSELTTRERTVMKNIIGDPLTPCVKYQADWLRHRGLGKKLLRKLIDNGMTLPAKPILSHYTDGLTARTAYALFNFGCNSKEEVMEAFQSGELSPKNRKARNYGKKAHSEVAKWLGLPDPFIKDDKKCPCCGHIL